MRGLNTADYWDKEHISTGRESKFNMDFFNITRHMGGRVLDIGVGMSKNFMVLVSTYKCEFHALDLSQVAVDFWKSHGVKAVKFDVKENSKLPYPDNYFDFVMTKSFLEHISKEDNYYLAKEIKRILKPMGGFMVMCASDFFQGGPFPREHIYPTEQGGVPVSDLMDMYKDFRLMNYNYINGEHYAVFRWG